MVLVVGATGSLGRRIVHKLRAQGEDVRVLVRPASDWAELERAGAEIALGDLKEPPSLDRACAGVEVVVTTANSAKRGGADNVETVDLTGNRNLIDAAARAGVRRFVFVSVLGAEEQWAASLSALASARGFIKNWLRHHLDLRVTPDLQFRADRSMEHAARIQTLLKDLHPDDGGRE